MSRLVDASSPLMVSQSEPTLDQDKSSEPASSNSINSVKLCYSSLLVTYLPIHLSTPAKPSPSRYPFPGKSPRHSECRPPALINTRPFLPGVPAPAREPPSHLLSYLRFFFRQSKGVLSESHEYKNKESSSNQ